MKLARASLLLLCSLSGCLETAGAGDPSLDPNLDPATRTSVMLTPPEAPYEELLPKEAMEIRDEDALAAASRENATVSANATPPAITYHGGPVLLGTPNVYLVWYGAWAGNSAQTILPAFVTALSGSPWFHINASYKNASNAAVTGALKLAGQASDAAYSRGKAITDNDVATIVFSAITAHKLPYDANGIYVVLASSDVNETSGFCTKYCGWHSDAVSSSQLARIQFIGNPDRCPTSCEVDTTKSPNGNPGADGMASILAHELAETVTDPNLNAWFDAAGAENADKCAWTFGTMYNAANGSKANVKLAGKDYLVQQNWVNTGAGSCVMSY